MIWVYSAHNITQDKGSSFLFFQKFVINEERKLKCKIHNYIEKVFYVNMYIIKINKVQTELDPRENLTMDPCV